MNKGRAVKEMARWLKAKNRLVLVSSVAVVIAVSLALTLREPVAAPAPEPTPVVYTATAHPDPLTPHDEGLYTAIYEAQAEGDFALADEMIARLDSQLLLGHVLAQRYLHEDYKTEASELKYWLHAFSDHPQRARIAALAARKGVRTEVAQREKPLSGAGYIDHLGAKSMPAGWYHGLSLWRSKSYDKAAVQFEKVATTSSLNEWHKAAAYFWAHRSYERAENDRAEDMLDLAAEYPTTFYGMLANAKLNHSGNWMAAAPYVPSSLRRQPSVLRAQALASIGRENEAEEELRAIFSTLPRHERKAMVTLASEFNLPNLQVRLSKMKELTDEEALFASYPMPAAVAEVQTTVDSAMIFAISRQESGFRPNVASHAGAVGMMQVLPSTANHIARSLGTELASSDVSRAGLQNADINVRLGAAYIQMLMREPHINGSWIHAIASYNAGPGAVASWARLTRNVDDPLLYIESIPYSETRNYVVQVLAHYWVYQHLMGEQSITLQSLAAGAWPHYKQS
ncbi:MAG: lytic transglycosylase domain-containing protein [Alphaproteobacteria bacterium]|nr:lytic transglycosylase domain-containing protein [Alphaproteobacteria bacterium]